MEKYDLGEDGAERKGTTVAMQRTRAPTLSRHDICDRTVLPDHTGESRLRSAPPQGRVRHLVDAQIGAIERQRPKGRLGGGERRTEDPSGAQTPLASNC